MKKISLILALICSIFIVIIVVKPPAITFEGAEVTAPAKPKSVPDDAFWIGGVDGGNFIFVSKRKGGENIYMVRIYNDFTGELEYDGELKYSGSKVLEGSLTNPALYQGWDGEMLHLSNGEYMAMYKNTVPTRSSNTH